MKELYSLTEMRTDQNVAAKEDRKVIINSTIKQKTASFVSEIMSVMEKKIQI